MLTYIRHKVLDRWDTTLYFLKNPVFNMKVFILLNYYYEVKSMTVFNGTNSKFFRRSLFSSPYFDINNIINKSVNLFRLNDSVSQLGYIFFISISSHNKF